MSFFEGFTPVAKDQFFTKITNYGKGGVDVHPSIRDTPFPYTRDWKKKNGETVGISKDYYAPGTKHPLLTQYYLKTP